MDIEARKAKIAEVTKSVEAAVEAGVLSSEDVYKTEIKALSDLELTGISWRKLAGGIDAGTAGQPSNCDLTTSQDGVSYGSEVCSWMLRTHRVSSSNRRATASTRFPAADRPSCQVRFRATRPFRPTANGRSRKCPIPQVMAASLRDLI